MFKTYRICLAEFFPNICWLIICCTVGAALAAPEMTWEQLNSAIDRQPTDASLWLQRGQILAKTFEDKEAIDNFTKAIKLNPNLVKAYIGRGDSYFSSQRTTDALTDYQHAQSLLIAQKDSKSQTFFDLQTSLARCYKLLKQYDKELPLRVAIAKKTVALIPDVTALAECQAANHLPKDASLTYQRAIKQDPIRTKLYRQYGDFLVSTGDYATAVEIYGQGIQLLEKERGFDTVGNHVLYDRRATCYDKLGKKDLAMQDRRRALKYNESVYDTIPTFDSRNK